MARSKLDKLALKMEKFRVSHPDWRTNPEWKKLCEEFGPLYNEDYELRKLIRKM